LLSSPQIQHISGSGFDATWTITVLSTRSRRQFLDAIHPDQYALAGAGVTIFFLLLLSLSTDSVAQRH
jgi:inner membrane protein involved in colicin E2 resistance